MKFTFYHGKMCKFSHFTNLEEEFRKFFFLRLNELEREQKRFICRILSLIASRRMAQKD